MEQTSAATRSHAPARARVSVVIPNWNGMAHLPECLTTLRAQSFSDFETIVVDNASSDGSVAWLAEHAPWVRVIVREDNGGFARAVNAGIRASEAEYVALLNNDVALEPDWLGALVSALDERPEYSVASSRMVLYDDRAVMNAAGDRYSLRLLAGMARGLGDPVGEHDRPLRVLGASAGSALYRRALFDDIGLFDEDFFLLSEDTDLNLRALIAGHRCLYVPGSVVYHKWHATIGPVRSPEIAYQQVRNAYVVVAKDLPRPARVIATFVRPWRLFRDAVPLDPRKWGRLPQTLGRPHRRGRAAGGSRARPRQAGRGVVTPARLDACDHAVAAPGARPGVTVLPGDAARCTVSA